MYLSEQPIPSPRTFRRTFPLSAAGTDFITRSRASACNIIHGEDRRLLLIVGPCSVHDTEAAFEYAIKLKDLSNIVEDSFLIMMRTYVEKARTTVGWKGLAYDPDLDGSHDISKGITETRRFLVKLSELGMPAATEFVDPAMSPYYSDLISWGSVGARSSAAQSHRQMASGLSMPIGFKNGTDGNIGAAVNGALAARHPHTFLGTSLQGIVASLTTTGNPDSHVVLRGGESGPNYGSEGMTDAVERLSAAGIVTRILIDISHGNCGHDSHTQENTFQTIMGSIAANPQIAGMLIESYLDAGKQPFSALPDPRLSITDPCLDWETTEALILEAHRGLWIPA